MDKFYILDCCGNLCGNKKGYSTMRGAHIQANSRKSKVYGEIWNSFYKHKENNPLATIVYSIKSQEA